MLWYSLEGPCSGTSNEYQQYVFSWRNKKTEPAHDKTYKKNCATSEDSDQPMHLHSLIRVFADRMYFLQPLDYPRGINENSCHTGWIYRLSWVFFGHTGLFIGFVMRWLKCYVDTPSNLELGPFLLWFSLLSSQLVWSVFSHNLFFFFYFFFLMFNP